MIKLVATDMDGTLLDENGHLPEGFFEIFNRVQAKNIKLAIASGRPYYSLQHIFGPFSNSMSFICENGALVVDNDKIIYEDPIDGSLVAEVIDVSKSISNTVAVLCTAKCAYIQNCSDEYLTEIKKYYNVLKVVDDLKDVTEDVIKFAICNFENSSETLDAVFKPKFENKLNVVGSGDIWIDISNKDVNKGSALKNLMEIDKISKEETMALGDYYNDIEMLNQAEYSFVMENAPKDMKQHGKYIAASNVEHGVLRAILEYAL